MKGMIAMPIRIPTRRIILFFTVLLVLTITLQITGAAESLQPHSRSHQISVTESQDDSNRLQSIHSVISCNSDDTEMLGDIAKQIKVLNSVD